MNITEKMKFVDFVDFVDRPRLRKNKNCPFCLLAKEEFREPLVVVPDDVILKTEKVTVFISSKWWSNNKGRVIVILENLYDIEPSFLHEISDIPKKMAIALKIAYKCDGITIRQLNEPAGS